MIRKAEFTDLPQILKIYEDAREFMRQTGNPNQWWDYHPAESILREDIPKGQLYVWEEDGKLLASFAYIPGIDPTYLQIDGPGWLNEEPYGVIHRIAVAQRGQGLIAKIFDWALERCPNLRIDTHVNNQPMRRALEKYGFFEEANKTAQATLEHQWQTYTQYEPHTIWECYSPTEPKPASKTTGHRVTEVRPDFCGWSALGPISLFIENVLGFYDVDAPTATVRWNLHQTCRHGIKDLSFGDIVTDIIYEDGKVMVESNKPYTLYINGQAHEICRGNNKIKL